jgi:hypothetical protein
MSRTFLFEARNLLGARVFSVQSSVFRQHPGTLPLQTGVSMSFAIHWIKLQKNRRFATTSGFYDEMRAKGLRKAFSLVTTKNPRWLPQT